MKPIALAAAYSAGVLQLHDTINCQGALDMDHPTRNRCWIFRQSLGSYHGPLNGHQAIMVSCNVFFYTLGQRFGLERLVKWYGKFGLGQITDCGLTPEHAGYLPELDDKGHIVKANLGVQDAVQMARQAQSQLDKERADSKARERALTAGGAAPAAKVDGGGGNSQGGKATGKGNQIKKRKGGPAGKGGSAGGKRQVVAR